jgi:hypothetical protein
MVEMNSPWARLPAHSGEPAFWGANGIFSDGFESSDPTVWPSTMGGP